MSGKTRKGHAPRRARGSNTAATSAASDRAAEHAEPSPEQQAAFWQGVQERLGLRFQHPELLREALTHRSYIYETRTTDGRYNERLEFLGDAILAFLSADYLFQTYPTLSEGELTDARAALVKTPTLADFARRLDLGAALRLGRGEERSGGRLREPLLAAAFEALLGAVYLDRGLAAARDFLGPSLAAEAQRVIAAGRFKDDKSLLQELAQAHLSITPRYRVVSEEGPSHSRMFTVEVLLGNDVAGRGQGRNKQSAEQEAARLALEANGWL